jgi:hypothetical protein
LQSLLAKDLLRLALLTIIRLCLPLLTENLLRLSLSALRSLLLKDALLFTSLSRRHPVHLLRSLLTIDLLRRRLPINLLRLLLRTRLLLPAAASSLRWSATATLLLSRRAAAMGVASTAVSFTLSESVLI